MASLACSPNPSPNPSRTATAPAPTLSPTPTPTRESVAGIDWGEPVRLPGSHAQWGAASAVSFQGRIIVASTLASVDGVSIGIWSSTDGVEWSLDKPQSLSSSRATGLVVGPDGLVLSGTWVESGLQAPGTPTATRAAIWTSRDGRSWTDVAGGTEFDTGLIADLATDGSGILVVGNAPMTTPEDEACPTAAIWRSTDGETWQTVAPPEPCARLLSVAGHQARFVVLGEFPNPSADGTLGAATPVAWLVDGEAPWKRLDEVPPAGAHYALVDGPPGFVLIPGSPTVAGADLSSVLASADGETWTTMAEGNDFGRGPGNGATLTALGFADAFYVSWVRRTGEGLMETALFRSPDGSAWSPVPQSAALDRSPTLTSVVLHEGTVVGIGGGARILAWVSPPSASGPEPPTFAEVQVVETSMPGAGVPRAVAFDGDTALAVGSEQEPVTGTVQSRVWSWSPATGWETIEAIGLDGASLSGLAHGDVGWAAIGSVARHLDDDPNKPLYPVATTWASSDGQRWTATTVGGPGELTLTGIVAARPGFVAIGHSFDASCDVAGLPSVVLTSPDGLAWTPVDDSDLHCVAIRDIVATDGRVVAVGATNRLVVTPASSSTPCDLDVCLGGTAFSQGRPAAFVSENGREWSPAVGLDLGWSTGFTSVASGPGGYVATWAGDTLFSSPDGLTWTPTYLPIAPSFVQARGISGTRVGYVVLGRETVIRPDGSGPAEDVSLFFSADGRTWQEVGPAAWSPEPGTFVSAMDGADGSGFLLLGVLQGQQPANLSWFVTLPGS